jgi:hypothetical protein
MIMSNIHTAYFSDLNSNGLSDEDQEPEEVCIANISPYERQLRVKFAIRQFVITLVILGAMIALHLNPLWRLLLFFLFSASTVSYFQARDKT